MKTNLEKLEFNQITKKLSKYCKTYIGEKLALNLLPKSTFEEVQNLLNETNEAVNMLIQNQTPGFDKIEPIDIELHDLSIGSSLSCASLLNLNNVLNTSYSLKEYFNKDFIIKENYPILDELFSKLYTNKSIIDKIKHSIINDETVDDNASKQLASIRRKQRKIESDIRSKLNSMLHSKYIQESIITTRNNRFVIPVKEEYRTQVKGLVHDVSSTGSTLFIEPMSIFEMNNQLNKLKIEEEQEISKILQELSELFIPYINELKEDMKLIGQIDFIFAKATYSRDLKATTPKVNKEKEFNLINAKHPLLNPEKVVPITINLGKDYQSLVITGPNTGGKTVTLKTVGLLSLMASSGLNIPVDLGSSIYVFDNIFADIGDDQSISDSLSTFSSHMINLVNIINTSTENSLILVDELGSGTDPVEGANLAISILEHFYNQGCLTVATTHYQELKQYALVTKGFKNASVEFNVETLTPTYHLLIGVPGKSNAFAISENLGLNKEIIENAKSRLSHDEINLEELLKNIYETKTKIEKEKEEIEQKLKEITKQKETIEKEKNDLLIKKENIINKAKIQARDILIDTKDDVREFMKELTSISQNNRKSIELIRQTLNDNIKSLTPESQIKEDKNKIFIKPEEIKINKKVFVRSLQKDGIIISNLTKSNEVQVQIGFLKLSVNINDLEMPHNDKESTIKLDDSSSVPKVSKTKTVKTEVNVIGLNTNEALFVVDKFLDDCSLANLKTARIVHGKGAGILRKAIHKYLAKQPQVKSYRLGIYGEGEMGVTIVEFKK